MFQGQVMPTTTKISITVLVLAVCVFCYGYISYERYNWLAVEQPIDLNELGEYQLSFQSQLNAGYELVLKTERKLDLKEQNCRLGLNSSARGDCAENTQQLLLAWSVFEGANKIASGKSNETKFGIWGETIGKTLHSFPTEKGQEYNIKVEVIHTDQALAATNPVLSVLIGSGVHKGAFVSRSLAFFASYLLVGIGVLVWFSGHYFRWWRNKRIK